MSNTESASRRQFLGRIGSGLLGAIAVFVISPVEAALGPRAERRQIGEPLQMTLEAVLKYYYRGQWQPWHDDVGVGIWSFPNFNNGQLNIWVDGRLPLGGGVDIQSIMVSQDNWVITRPARRGVRDLREALQDHACAASAIGPGLQDFDLA